MSDINQCIAEQALLAEGNKKIGEIRIQCKRLLQDNKAGAIADNQEKSAHSNENEGQLTPLEKRLMREYLNRDNPNVITSHKRNYLLPFSYVDTPNDAPYEDLSNGHSLDNFEAKFQISFKAPIAESIINKDDMLFFGFTLQSYWQMYNSEISSPFRETNYQPEIFYGLFNDFQIGEWTNRVNVIGIEHQSNGRSQPLSRSWNRVYIQQVWENDNWIILFRPWYRLPEDSKEDPIQADGDDNPDIDKYMGHFEFSSVYKWQQQTFGIMLRNNLRKKNKGALQLEWTFPMGKRFKGYAQYFNGYGESLIDYNHSVQRLGIGVLLTDLF